MNKPTSAELTPIKVTFNRTIRETWNEPGKDGWNLDHELMDLLAHPQFLDEGDTKFLRWLRKSAVRGHREAWLCPLHARRLAHLADRVTQPMLGRHFLLRQREKEAAYAV